MTAPAHLIAFTIDCSDAAVLARFYSGLTGGEITAESSEYGYASVTFGPHVLNFQRVRGYTAPRWPTQDRPQQFHLDFRVDDLTSATESAVALGATVAAEQPGGQAYRVLLDPDGHPFCLCPPAQSD